MLRSILTTTTTATGLPTEEELPQRKRSSSFISKHWTHPEVCKAFRNLVARCAADQHIQVQYLNHSRRASSSALLHPTSGMREGDTELDSKVSSRNQSISQYTGTSTGVCTCTCIDQVSPSNQTQYDFKKVPPPETSVQEKTVFTEKSSNPRKISSHTSSSQIYNLEKCYSSTNTTGSKSNKSLRERNTQVQITPKSSDMCRDASPVTSGTDTATSEQV